MRAQPTWSPTDLSSISWVHYSFFQQCYHVKRSVIMLNAILSIAGSSHQSRERFSEISRGRQCFFMSFSALLCAQSFPVRHWDIATVDQILIEGDRMYLNALESQNIPDTDTLLDTSIARHWGRRTKWIARWGNKIPFWGKQCKTIARWGKHFFKQITYYGPGISCYFKHQSSSLLLLLLFL